MRFATYLVAALLSTSTLATQNASACGGSYEEAHVAPAVMLVSSHPIYKQDSGTQISQRVFAVAGTRPDLAEREGFERIEWHSYDSTAALPLAPLKRATTITLVGASGVRVVRTRAHVALKHAFFRNGTFDAMELPATAADDLRGAIALSGSHTDAVWHELAGSYTLTQGIRDTDLEVTADYSEKRAQVTIRSKSGDLGTYEGYALGALDVDGARYVVISRADGTAYTVPTA